MKLLITTVALVAIFSCKSTVSQTLEQGIKGKVLWLEGNFMPGPGQNNEGQPVERQLYIYQALKTVEMKKSGQFYAIPAKEPVKVVASNAQGQFSVDLEPGTYSILSKEEKGLFANLQDGDGNINPVTVKEGTYTDFTFKIDYKAVY